MQIDGGYKPLTIERKSKMSIPKSSVGIGLAIVWACGLIWSAGNLALGSPQDMAALAGGAGGSTPDCENCHEGYWTSHTCSGIREPGESCPTDECMSLTNYYAYCEFEKDAGPCPICDHPYLKKQIWCIYDVDPPCVSVLPSPELKIVCGCSDEPNCELFFPCWAFNNCSSGTLIEEGESEEYRPVCC
jgi:hypothetical protein